MNKQGVIFFDLTQLLLRVFMPTPSGIGRVELAYARHLLEHYSDQTVFVFAFTRFVRVVPTEAARQYVIELERIWQTANKISTRLESRLRIFIPSGLLKSDQDSTGATAGFLRRSNSLKRYWLAARVLWRIAIAPGRRKLTLAAARRDRQNAYISVSNCVFSSTWIVRWLEKSPLTHRIYFLHDIIPITNPEFTVPHISARHFSYVKRLTDTAHTIIANSAYTKQCLKDFVEDSAWRMPNVVVAPLGVDEIFIDDGEPEEETQQYFVFIATIEPRKNHLMLLQVWQRLVADYGQRAPRLILVGRRGWENENILDVIDRAKILRDYVIECSNVSDALMVKLLRNARAALFPSHLEGYGLPLAEALALGVPVICSDIPPFREIATDIPEYVDPLAGRGWLKLVMDYANPMSGRRDAQLQRIKRYLPHQWKNHFGVLDDLLIASKVASRPHQLSPREGQYASDLLPPVVLGEAIEQPDVERRRVTVGKRLEHLNRTIAEALARSASFGEFRVISGVPGTGNMTLCSYRGLRCVVVTQSIRALDAPDDGRHRDKPTLDFAHIVVSVQVPNTILDSNGPVDLDQCILRFAVLSDAMQVDPSRLGSIVHIMADLQNAYVKLARDDTTRRSVEALAIGLQNVTSTLAAETAVTHELAKLLATGTTRALNARL